jgi:nitrogen-specific signal transduction histidine kinase
LNAADVLQWLSGEGFTPATVVTALVSMLIASLAWWSRVRRLARMRETILELHTLSEAVFSAASAGEIAERLSTTLGEVLDAGRVHVWVVDPQSGVLAPMAGPGPDAGRGATAERCFKEQKDVAEEGPPARHFFPMVRNSAASGLLEVEWKLARRTLHFDERAAVQHLANQTAIAFELLDQRHLREQVLRGEKLGAAGQLIAGVARELQEPLARIVAAAGRLAALDLAGGDEESLRVIADEAAAASETLDRLVSFGAADRNRARPLELNELLRGLLEFRSRTWRLQLVQVTENLAAAPLPVVGAQGQLEQAFLSLLVQAEQVLAEQPQRRLRITTDQADSKARVAIEFPMERDFDEGAAGGIGVARGILETHGGSLSVRRAAGLAGFEVNLPLSSADPGPKKKRERLTASRSLTLLLVEPDPVEHRHLVEHLAARKHRVAPAAGGADALEMVTRLRFDAILASAALHDMAWPELLERSRRHTPAFIVFTDMVETAGHPLARSGDAIVLRKPVEDADLDRALAAVDVRASAPFSR